MEIENNNMDYVGEGMLTRVSIVTCLPAVGAGIHGGGVGERVE